MKRKTTIKIKSSSNDLKQINDGKSKSDDLKSFQRDEIVDDEEREKNSLKHSISYSKYLKNVEQGIYDDPVSYIYLIFSSLSLVTPCFKCHQAQPSLFTTTSHFTNYRGLINLCIILLIMSTSRLVLENIIK
jgi:hypothetical protein